MWAGGLVQILADWGFSTAASRAALSRLVTRGLLQRHRDGREVFYSLTDRAAIRLADDERRILEFTSADASATWTMLSYALAPSRRAERDRLRRRLLFLGYGSTSDGSWIAAGDRVNATDRVLRDLGLDRDVMLFVGRPAMSTDVSRVVAKAWPDLDDLADRYDAFTARWSSAPDDSSALTARTMLMHEWRQFPLADPGLADLYLPWARRRSTARDLFQHTWHRLADPAAESFGELCRIQAAVVAS